MSVTEIERHQLFKWFEENMGQQRAATMMSLVPPVGWADVATKHDLAELEARLESRLDVIEARLDRIDARLDRTDARLDGIADSIQAQNRTFVTWLFVSQATVVSILGVVIAVT